MIRHMYKMLILAVLLLVAGCAGMVKKPVIVAPPADVATATGAFDPSKFTIHERMVHSVVMLPGCTGFVVRSNGDSSLILTAKHCLDGFQEVMKDGSTVTLPIPVATDLGWKQLCFGDIRAVDKVNDLALIGVDGCKLPTVVAPLAASEPKVGEPVYIVGHPMGTYYIMTKGVVSRPRFDGYILASAFALPGSSGGPMFNKRGEVIGLVTMILMTPTYRRNGASFQRSDQFVHMPHLQFGMTLENIKGFMNQYTGKAK